LLHLGHPLRAWQIFFTPNLSSAMAMFGFVYAWYLMVVLLLEIWFDYRADLVNWGRTAKFPLNWFYRILSLFSKNVSPEAIAFDKKMVKYITILGIPSAFILHGYVGFIFGSIKANPWWSSVLIPIVFLFSAIVSGIALVMLLYMVIIPSRGKPIDMKCLDKIASFLLYAAIVDFSLEILDFTHRLYESEESIKIITEMVMNKLFISLVVLQILIGMVVPLGILIITKLAKFNQELRKLLYFVTAILIQIGIFSTRWNVVLGGQMFSKSYRGLISYNMEILGHEGFLMALALLIAPCIILAILIKLLPPWGKEKQRLQEQ
jgi:predicted membrane protein